MVLIRNLKTVITLLVNFDDDDDDDIDDGDDDDDYFLSWFAWVAIRALQD